MFDALDRVGFMLPQTPQRDKDQKASLAAPLLGMIGGLGTGYLTRNSVSPARSALIGLGMWGGSWLFQKTILPEPHDYYGRDNQPSDMSIGLVSMAGAFGSTWAIHGIWTLVKAHARAF